MLFSRCVAFTITVTVATNLVSGSWFDGGSNRSPPQPPRPPSSSGDGRRKMSQLPPPQVRSYENALSDSLLNAMIQVESGGDENAIGDDGRSIGALQIQQTYYNDAVAYAPGLRYGGKTYADVAGKGSTAYAKRVVRAYMSRYATRERLGRTPTEEDIARIHNGGPNGYKMKATDIYWEKVKAALMRQGK